MADAKISELTAIDAVAGVDLFPVVDDPGGTPVTKKATANQIANYVLGLVSDLRPNILINGDFQVNQRAFAGGALAQNVYGFDRWKTTIVGGANLSLSGYVLTLTSGEIEQVIEPGVWGVSSLASRQVTVSVEAPSHDLTVDLGSQTGTITAGSGRRSVTLTLGAGDTGNLALKLKRASVGAVTFGRVKAELGATATAWQPRDAAAELALCQRYFWRRTRNGNFDVLFMLGFFNTTQAWGGAISFPVTMRAAPTVTISATADFRVWVTSEHVPTEILGLSGDRNGLWISTRVTIPGSVTGGFAGMFYFTNTNAGWIQASIEL